MGIDENGDGCDKSVWIWCLQPSWTLTAMTAYSFNTTTHAFLAVDTEGLRPPYGLRILEEMPISFGIASSSAPGLR
eukprot:4113627-Pleurochrysis_carterae.AAC.1